MRELAMVSLARAALTVARSVHDRHTKNAWPNDRDVELLTRSATTPTTFAAATALHQIALHFVASLVPVSAAAAAIARSLQLSFDHAAQISVPSLTLPSAAWIGEGLPIPFLQGTSTAGATVDPYKLASIIGLTGEMIRNTANAEAFMRQTLIESTAPTLDAAMFSANAAVPGVAPLASSTALHRSRHRPPPPRRSTRWLPMSRPSQKDWHRQPVPANRC